MKLLIEPATPDDAEALLKAQISAFEYDSVIYPGIEVGGPPGYDSLEMLKEYMEKADGYKILYNGEIVGGMVIFEMGDRWFHLGAIYIDPAHQNLGIGTRAMEFLERTYDAKRWTLNTPIWAVRNHHFYEKFGYVRVGEEKEEVTGILLIDYEKKVDD